jgi:hypothetical protein
MPPISNSSTSNAANIQTAVPLTSEPAKFSEEDLLCPTILPLTFPA